MKNENKIDLLDTQVMDLERKITVILENQSWIIKKINNLEENFLELQKFSEKCFLKQQGLNLAEEFKTGLGPISTDPSCQIASVIKGEK